MTYESRVEPEYFDKIKNNQKVFELRVNDEKRQQFKVGDFLIFKKRPEETETIITKIENLFYFKNFLEAISVLPMESLGFNNLTQPELNKLYYNFYTQDEVDKYGVVAIKIKHVGGIYDII